MHNIFGKNFNIRIKNPVYILMTIWTLTSAEQCTNTDACGSYNFNPIALKIIPTLNTAIPYGRARPVVQSSGGIDNVINVQASLWHSNNTLFGIKVESYALCNGIPRFKSYCCISRNENGCLAVGDETAYQVTATLPSTLKCKLTIRAVSNVAANADGVGTFDVYEGFVDIEPISGSPPTNTICNLVYKKKYSGWQEEAKQYCLFNQ